MNNIANLGAAPTAPAVQGLAGQTAVQGDNSSLFSALLMQQMGPDLSSAGDAQMPDLGQSLSGNADLAKILPAFMAQSKDAKLSLPLNRQTSNAADGTDTNPIMAMWLASMAATQIQPNPQNSAPQLNGLASQLTGNGTEQNAALQALEQQFPGLAMALKNKPLVVGKDVQGKEPILNNAGQESVEVKIPDVKTPDVKIPDVKPVDGKNEFNPALNAAHIQDSAKPAAPQAPVHVNAEIPAATVKMPDASDKSKPDQKDLSANTNVKDSAPAVPQITPQNQNSDAKPQSQGQPNDNHAGGQAKKDSASATQIQQAAGPANSVSSSNTTVDPTNFAAMTQAVHNASGNAANHQVAPATGQAVSVHEVSAAIATDPTPRIVHAARLMEAAGQAEMRVSVKNDLSGTVDVRAMLENGNISATVAAQHGGTRDWLMANMHELQTTLSRDDLNLKTFEVTDAGLQNNGRGDEPKQQEPQQQQRNASYSNFAPETHSNTTSFDDVESPETSSRALSLLA